VTSVDARSLREHGEDVAARIEPQPDGDTLSSDRRTHLDDVVLDLAPVQVAIQLHGVRNPRQLSEVAHRLRLIRLGAAGTEDRDAEQAAAQ
jgi:hypothetical protein